MKVIVTPLLLQAYGGGILTLQACDLPDPDELRKMREERKKKE